MNRNLNKLSIEYQSYPKLTKIDSFKFPNKRKAHVAALVMRILSAFCDLFH